MKSKIIVCSMMAFAFMVLWLFARPYWTDKNSEVVYFSETFAVNGGLWAYDFPCLYEVRGQPITYKTLPTWANEPPIIHYLGAGIKKLGFTNQYQRVLTILLYLILVAGLAQAFFLLQPSTQGHLPWVCFFFIPAFIVHSTRILPDWVMIVCLIWGVYFLFKDRLLPAFFLFLIAVTAKALAAFALVPIVYGAVFTRKKWDFKGYAKMTILMALICLPMIYWLWLLKSRGILNPFFKQDMTPHHMGGSNFAALADIRYWERFWMWNFRNGTSIVLMLTSFYQLWKMKLSWSKLTWQMQTVAIWALGVLPYWVVVRGTQATAPWYSFSFILAWSLLGVMGIFHLSTRIRYAAVGLLAILGLAQVGWTTNYKENLDFDIKTTPIGLACPELWLK